MYNASTDDVNVIDQKMAAYQLDRKSKFRFYLGMPLTLPLWIATLCIQSLVIQFPYLISKLLLQNRWLEGISIGKDLFFWAEQTSKKHWSHHCQRKYQHTCHNSTRSALDAIFTKMKELTINHPYLVQPVVCTFAVPKREIAF